jgi:hypothetical protein
MVKAENFSDHPHKGGLEKTLQRISKPQLKRVQVCEWRQHTSWFDEECS